MEPREAMLGESLAEGRVRCRLCAHRCVIDVGSRGVCGVRENVGGTLKTLVYGRSVSECVDPIEKKPLNHFHPGSASYSIATPGCNLRCRWCQNHHIVSMSPEELGLLARRSSPNDVVAAALQTGCDSIAYTYTEPTVFLEYALATARLAHAHGLGNVFVTNGYMTINALEYVRPYLDAANVDLKSFRDETYRTYIGARLEPVLETLRYLRRAGVWLEVTTLVVPGINDSERELRDIAEFISGDLGAATPWHVSRFHPSRRFVEAAPTPFETLRRAAAIGREANLDYVYVGNVPGESNTHCPACGAVVVRRLGYVILANDVDPESKCPRCGATIAGVGMSG